MNYKFLIILGLIFISFFPSLWGIGFIDKPVSYYSIIESERLEKGVNITITEELKIGKSVFLHVRYLDEGKIPEVTIFDANDNKVTNYTTINPLSKPTFKHNYLQVKFEPSVTGKYYGNISNPNNQPLKEIFATFGYFDPVVVHNQGLQAIHLSDSNILHVLLLSPTSYLGLGFIIFGIITKNRESKRENTRSKSRVLFNVVGLYLIINTYYILSGVGMSIVSAQYKLASGLVWSIQSEYWVLLEGVIIIGIPSIIGAIQLFRNKRTGVWISVFVFGILFFTFLFMMGFFYYFALVDGTDYPIYMPHLIFPYWTYIVLGVIASPILLGLGIWQNKKEEKVQVDNSKNNIIQNGP